MAKSILESKINTPLILFLERVIFYCDKLIFRIDSIIANGEEKSIGLNELDKLVKEEAEYLRNSINELKTDKRYASEELLNDALFATVALVDEIMISKTWFGKEFWGWNTLEKTLFQSQASGEIFYQKAEKILENRDYRYREVAYIYYVCLCLGFKGKYHDSTEQDKIEKLKTDLYNFYLELFDEASKSKKYSLFSRGGLKNQRAAFEDMLSRRRKTNFLFYYNILIMFVFIGLSFVIWDYFESRVVGQIQRNFFKEVAQKDHH